MNVCLSLDSSVRAPNRAENSPTQDELSHSDPTTGFQCALHGSVCIADIAKEMVVKFEPGASAATTREENRVAQDLTPGRSAATLATSSFRAAATLRPPRVLLNLRQRACSARAPLHVHPSVVRNRHAMALQIVRHVALHLGAHVSNLVSDPCWKRQRACKVLLQHGGLGSFGAAGR